MIQIFVAPYLYKGNPETKHLLAKGEEKRTFRIVTRYKIPCLLKVGITFHNVQYCLDKRLDAKKSINTEKQSNHDEK